jgi:hypothetical protein
MVSASVDLVKIMCLIFVLEFSCTSYNNVVIVNTIDIDFLCL